MKFYKIEAQAGGLFLERRSSMPVYTSEAKGRLIYDTVLDQVYVGTDSTDVTDYVAMFDEAHHVRPLVGSTYDVGSAAKTFREIHADDLFGNLTGNVTGNVTGDLNGDVYSDNGLSKVLENGGNTPANATFTGTATKAKYA